MRARLSSSIARARASRRSIREELLFRRAVVSLSTAGIWLITAGSCVITSSPAQESSSERLEIESARSVIIYSFTFGEPNEVESTELIWIGQAKKWHYHLFLMGFEVVRP